MRSKSIALLILAISLNFFACKKDVRIVNYFVSLQPNADNGVDAFIYDLEPDRNLGTHPDFMATAWTNGGHVIVRSLLKFDYSTIPSDALIDSIKLSLYSYESPANGSHSALSGSNSCSLQKIISSWNESSVTWNNQPFTTTENQVILPKSEYETQDYLEVDVTALVTEMIMFPANNHGVLLKLETEEAYRQLVFASSDNSDIELHPKLDIYYSRDEEY